MEDVPIVVNGSLADSPTKSSVSADMDESGAEVRSVVRVLDLLLADDTVELSSKTGESTTALLLIILCISKNTCFLSCFTFVEHCDEGRSKLLFCLFNSCAIFCLKGPFL